MAGVIVAGYDEVDGGSMYVIPLGGTCLKAPFAIGGSGSTYIYGHVDHEFKPDMSLAACKAFVAEAVKRAMARDGSSGGIIRLVVINAEGVERKLAVRELTKEFTALRRSDAEAVAVYGARARAANGDLDPLVSALQPVGAVR